MSRDHHLTCGDDRVFGRDCDSLFWLDLGLCNTHRTEQSNKTEKPRKTDRTRPILCWMNPRSLIRPISSHRPIRGLDQNVQPVLIRLNPSRPQKQLLVTVSTAYCGSRLRESPVCSQAHPEYRFASPALVNHRSPSCECVAPVRGRPQA